MNQNQARIGIVTVSDRASRGDYEDLGRPRDCRLVEQRAHQPWEAVTRFGRRRITTH